MKNKFIKYFLLSIPVILAVVFFVLYINASNQIDQLETKYNESVKKYDKAKQELNTENKSEEKLPDNTEIKAASSIALSSFDIKQLKKKGLSDPVQDIVSDLKKHNELIPYEGTLGGTMKFYGDNTIWVLTNKWVLAYFEDGHNAGYLLLEYDVLNNGEISWKRIASMRG